MVRHDPERMERAPRDAVAKAMYAEILGGRGTPDGAVLLDARPIGRAVLEARFADLMARARRAGRDLAEEPVPVAPASHIGIGGVVIDARTATTMPGLFVAGEDAGGVHGASWQGGNGIAESTVFGARAGEAAATAAVERSVRPVSEAAIADAVRSAFAPLERADGPSPFSLSAELRELMWERAGLVRDEPGLADAAARLAELEERVATIAVPGPARANPAWQEALDLRSSSLVARLVVAAARVRLESRGMHVRTDHPMRNDRDWLRSVVLHRADDLRAAPLVDTRPVALDRLRPDGLATADTAMTSGGTPP
jgi:succinate dehydrogenase / fumarate reductase flavoprotein subunit/fumarate reductase flavoprotein subunit